MNNMMDASKIVNLDCNDQIRRLTNLREDIRSLLGAHSKGIWFRMFPKVFYMHFNRDIQLDVFAITNPLFFLDYISDMIKFDLPENLDEEDFIIELNDEAKNIPLMADRSSDLNMKRDILLQMLHKVNLENRRAILREICIIDEYLKHQKEVSPSPKVPTHEQVAVRLQKMRSIIDFCLRCLLKPSNDISHNDLCELFNQSDEFLSNITPLAQRLSALSTD